MAGENVLRNIFGLGSCREGVYRGHEGTVIQMLVLGDRLLSLGTDNRLLVWKLYDYGSPQVCTYQITESWTPTPYKWVMLQSIPFHWLSDSYCSLSSPVYILLIMFCMLPSEGAGLEHQQTWGVLRM